MGLSGLFKRKGKPDLPEGETRQTGDGVNITAGKVEAEQIIGTQNVYHLPEPGAPLAPLPDLPPEGELPPAQDALPPGSSMQLIRNHIFTGREADLHIVAHNLLYSGGAGRVGISQRAGVWGLGGIGKTQLAAEFCYRYGRFFEGVHWIAAGQPEGIEAQIAACGARMGLKPWPEGVPEQAERTLAEWEQSRRRLVVLDNLEEPDALRQWLPRFACVKLLITTRRAHWSPELGLDLHAIDVLPRPEGRALLRRLAARLASAPDADLDALLDLLGDLPQAVDLAGRYLAERSRLPVKKYLEELDGQANLLEHSAFAEGMDATPSLAATFHLSWQRLGGESRLHSLARRVFQSAGWCAPNVPIPPELLCQAVEDKGDSPEFDRALKRLADLGLLKEQGESVYIHPLLAQFARGVKVEDTFTPLDHLSEACLRLGARANSAGLPAAFAPLIPHMQALLAYLQGAGQDFTDAWTLLRSHLAYYFFAGRTVPRIAPAA